MNKLIKDSRISSVINDLRKDEHIEVISQEKTHKINREIASVVEKVRKDFELREKNSRAFAAQVELATFGK